MHSLLTLRLCESQSPRVDSQLSETQEELRSLATTDTFSLFLFSAFQQSLWDRAVMFASEDLPGVLVPGLRSPKCLWLQLVRVQIVCDRPTALVLVLALNVAIRLRAHELSDTGTKKDKCERLPSFLVHNGLDFDGVQCLGHPE